MAKFLPLDGQALEPTDVELQAAFLRGLNDAALGPVSAGALLPDVTNPETVRALKNRLDPSVRALDGQVASCPNLTPEQKSAWGLFSKGWRDFYDGPDNNSPFPSWIPLLGAFGSANVFDGALVYERQIIEWQKMLDGACHAALPRIVPQSEPHEKDAETVGELVKWGVLGAFGIVGLIALTSARK